MTFWVLVSKSVRYPVDFIPGSKRCKRCPVGSYQSVRSQTTCSPCQAGTYQDLTGQVALSIKSLRSLRLKGATITGDLHKFGRTSPNQTCRHIISYSPPPRHSLTVELRCGYRCWTGTGVIKLPAGFPCVELIEMLAYFFSSYFVQFLIQDSVLDTGCFGFWNLWIHGFCLRHTWTS